MRPAAAAAIDALQFGQRGEQDEYEPAHWGARVDVLLDHREVGTGGAETRGQIDSVPVISGESGQRLSVTAPRLREPSPAVSTWRAGSS
jgi:hypothetical protein